MSRTIAIIGGGAAGIFGAIAAAAVDRSAKVIVLEATGQPLDKVRISGGGRCNVTHHCFDPAELVKSYPRGHRELRSVFSRFQPRDTVDWFENHGVTLKAEPDGRMFPVTDDSATVVECLLNSAQELGVELRRECRVKAVTSLGDVGTRRQFEIDIHGREPLACDRLLIATGSSPQGYRFAESLGHSVVPCVPS
ncbi:aminoacetone oxidase family FAD-binding enzyme, partial [candidate division GN15 bacterium]